MIELTTLQVVPGGLPAGGWVTYEPGAYKPGDFISLPVVEIGQGIFRTQNSVYQIREL